MKPKIKDMNWFVELLTFWSAEAITLAPFGIYIRKDWKAVPIVYQRIIREEQIHWAQQVEMWIVPFYLWYFIEWFIRIVLPPWGAYKEISMEREAKANISDLDYLKTRKRFAWWYYLTHKK
jgi:hypothetical protein